MKTKRLWESEHPYYACSGNYFSKDCHQGFGSIEAFLEEEGGADVEMNLLYRWDWRTAGSGWTDDDDDKDILQFFFVGQRKALARSVFVRIDPKDRERVEPLVRAYLAPRLAAMNALWAPLTTQRAKVIEECALECQRIADASVMPDELTACVDAIRALASKEQR